MNAVFKALNDPTRRQILDMLRAGDKPAGEIAEAFEMAGPSVSHHLDLLAQAGLVERYRKGRHIYYSLTVTVLDEIIGWFGSLQQNGRDGAPQS